MQVSLENIGSLERRLTVSFPSTDLDGRVQERLHELSHSVRLKGFRPGKVPMKVIEQRYGDQVRGEELSAIIRRTFEQAVSEQNLRPVSPPAIDTDGHAKNGEIAYSAQFEVFPELPAVDVASLQVERIVAVVTDHDIDVMIDTLRKQRQHFEDIDREVQKDDFVGFNYAVQTSEQRWPEEGFKRGGSVLGTGGVLKEVETALLGHRHGEELEIDVAFPDDFHNTDLAGKLARMTVKIDKVRGPVIPELDETFIRQFGIHNGSLQGFREEVRGNLERELNHVLSSRLKAQVAEKLAAAYPGVELPRAMLEEQAQSIARIGLEEDQQPSEAQILAAQQPAQVRVRAGLIMGEIARRENIQPEEARLSKALTAIASTYEDPQQVIKLYSRDTRFMNSLRNQVLEEQVAEWVAGHAQCTDTPLSFEEVLRPHQTD